MLGMLLPVVSGIFLLLAGFALDHWLETTVKRRLPSIVPENLDIVIFAVPGGFPIYSLLFSTGIGWYWLAGGHVAVGSFYVAMAWGGSGTRSEASISLLMMSVAFATVIPVARRIRKSITATTRPFTKMDKPPRDGMSGGVARCEADRHVRCAMETPPTASDSMPDPAWPFGASGCPRRSAERPSRFVGRLRPSRVDVRLETPAITSSLRRGGP